MKKFLLIAALTLVGCSAGGGEGPGTAGTGGAGGGTGGTGGSAPECTAIGEPCSLDVSACCNASTCVSTENDPEDAVCAANCTDHADCESGCCTELTNIPGAVCAPERFCPPDPPVCIDAGQSCAGRPDDCCVSSVCVANELGTNCADLCDEDTDCVSGCCAQLENRSIFVCSPYHYCQ